jgi:hypothetical protein
MTYQNLMSSGPAYNAHLESQDFKRFLKISVVIALILSMLFSIRGNFKGLMQTLEKDVVWLFIIAIAITVTSSLLSMISVVKINGLKIVSRVLIGIVAVGLFYISTRLTFIGFITGEQSQLVNQVQANPELSQAKVDLQGILDRQNEYGISQSEKLSLMSREKEQRSYIREIEKRLVIENRFKKSNLENAIGEEKRIAMTLFALGPELCIGVLSPLLVVLFSAGCGLRDERRIDQGEAPGLQEKIIYVPVQMPGNGNGMEKVEKPGVPSQAELASIAQNQNQGNGKAVKQLTNWNPFQ